MIKIEIALLWVIEQPKIALHKQDSFKEDLPKPIALKASRQSYKLKMH
jgi:hypothetical protein